MTAVFLSFSCRVLQVPGPFLVGTGSLANFYMSSWKGLLADFLLWMNEYNKHKELLSVGQTPSSILIGVVHWRLTNLWRDSFTPVTNYVSDGGNSAGTRSLHLWDTETYNLVRSSYWCRILHVSPTTCHDSFYDCTPFVSGREHSARNQVPTFVRIFKTHRT